MQARMRRNDCELLAEVEAEIEATLTRSAVFKEFVHRAGGEFHGYGNQFLIRPRKCDRNTRSGVVGDGAGVHDRCSSIRSVRALVTRVRELSRCLCRSVAQRLEVLGFRRVEHMECDLSDVGEVVDAARFVGSLDDARLQFAARCQCLYVLGEIERAGSDSANSPHQLSPNNEHAVATTMSATPTCVRAVPLQR